MTDSEKSRSEIPLPLRRYMETGRDGHLKFCYPYEVGVYVSEVNHIKRLLDGAMKRRGADKTAALREVQKFVDNVVEEHDLLHTQHNADMERRHAANDRAWQTEKPTRGGPTEKHPDAPYCKPDQSCCDFVCGN